MVHQNGCEGRLLQVVCGWPLQVVYGWPTGRPRMAQPVRVSAVSPQELAGVTALKAHEHCWRPREAPLVLQQVPIDETVRAVHRQGRRQPRWHRDRFGGLLPANLRLPRSSRLPSWKLFLLLSGMSNPLSYGVRGSQSEACTHRAICVEARGDPTGADLGQSC